MFMYSIQLYMYNVHAHIHYNEHVHVHVAAAQDTHVHVQVYMTEYRNTEHYPFYSFLEHVVYEEGEILGRTIVQVYEMFKIL